MKISTLMSPQACLNQSRPSCKMFQEMTFMHLLDCSKNALKMGWIQVVEGSPMACQVLLDCSNTLNAVYGLIKSIECSARLEHLQI